MNARHLVLAASAALAFGPLHAQGFAGLGTSAEGFALPDRAKVLAFPADHGPHPDFRIEWWYLTALLAGPDGREYGLQWTLFRTALAPGEADGWQSPQIWMGHAAVTTPDTHHVAERFARGGVGQAGVMADPFNAWIDEWAMVGPDMNNLTVSAQGADFGYEIEIGTEKPIVLQGDRGYSVKSADGHASHYYSQPFYEAEGTLRLPEGPVSVRGTAWLDREWSSQPLSEDQTGWDWFSLSFEDGERMMGFRLRERDGGAFTAATWIASDGTPTPYPDGRFSAEPITNDTVAGRDVPIRWRLRLPDKGLDVTVSALNNQSWMDTAFPYWEGPISMEGTHSGRGYLEMTGYE